MYINTKDHMRNVLNRAGIQYGGQMSESLEICSTIRRLAKKHHRLAEMDCNGEGYIRGQRYYGGAIDDYARKQYGYGVKSAYLTEQDSEEGTSVFIHESDKIEAKIKALVEKLPEQAKESYWCVEFQGDPRGNTVKLYYKGNYVDINF